MIIALSANVGEIVIEQALASGLNSYLSKPTTLSALEEALLEYFPSDAVVNEMLGSYSSTISPVSSELR